MAWMEEVERAARAAIADLRRYLALPSVSAQGRAIEETCAHVCGLLEGVGAEVHVLRGAGNPLVYAHLRGRSPRTLLFYDHYDVQPPEPLELWSSPPFELTEVDGRLVGRGAADNKGDLIARIAAIRALQQQGGLDVSVGFVVEGEEEIGSPTMEQVVHEHRALLQADWCIWEAGGVGDHGRPQLAGGVKGVLYVQFDVRTAAVDLHSSMAPVVENAAWRLHEALRCIRPQPGRVAIPGFYEAIAPLSASTSRLIEQIPYDADALQTRIEGRLRPAEDLRRALYTEPTCNLAGFGAGYQGDGAKTVLPSAAQAKMDFRLVMGQDPKKIYASLRQLLDAHGFTDVETTMLVAEMPYVSDPDDPFVAAVRAAVREAYGREEVYQPLIAGSGPMHALAGQLGIPCVSTGSGYYNARAHAPDENIRVQDFVHSAQAVAGLIRRLGG